MRVNLRGSQSSQIEKNYEKVYILLKYVDKLLHLSPKLSIYV